MYEFIRNKMAEGSGNEKPSGAYSRFLSERRMSSSSDNENSPTQNPLVPDLGISGQPQQSDKEKPGASHMAG